MKKMSNALIIGIAGVMTFSLAACGNNSGPAKSPAAPPPAQTQAAQPPATGPIKIGSAIYKFDDTFMAGVRAAMTDRANALGDTLNISDSQNVQATQNDQVDNFINQGVNSLIINPVDPTAAAPIIAKAKAASLPLVLINRMPADADMQTYDRVWYVGAHPEESGTAQGQIIADYWKAHPETDKNKDGVIDYVMLTGEPGHPDAVARTKYSIQTLTDAGIKVKELASDTAMWDKVKATDKMAAFITSLGIASIEVVFANNDDMALGAIAALQAQGYNKGDKSKYIPVVGVDATAPGLAAMKDGSLLGTVLNDAVNQAKAAVNIADAAGKNKEINDANVGYKVEGKYVWIPYVKVTQDNYKDFMS